MDLSSGVKRVIVFFFAACVLVSAGCNTPQDGPQQAANQPAPGPSVPPATTHDLYDFSSVDALLARIARKHGGCALVLVKDEKVIYRKGFGSHGPDKVIPVASASKWLAGAVIMSLVDEGKLSLDDQVSKYLPEFTDAKANITIRQLFSHTSGLPAEARCRNDKRTTLERCASEVARIKLQAEPGREFYYGGVSMHIGGRIAEIVSGKSWNELFVERVATPLGISQTDFFAYGPTGNPRPAGDARSSADEYARFLQMILQRGSFGGRRILSEASVFEMHKDQTGGARITYTIYEKHAALDQTLPHARYGIGMWREKTDASGQLLEASSQGALGFSPWIDFERNLAGVLSVRGSFSRALPDYLAIKDQIRRTVPD
ncbi:MAG TPA: serine hydrolase domain-containing protein [Pyrinomonadaceae bacterium]|nr:serine hydrolase domain-containing protein [Pyrinomonadaceae bacterium]